MKTLIIVESPTKAKTLNRYLSKDYKIIASKGHVRDLPKTTLAIDIDNGFKANYEISQDRKTLISDMKKELAKADRLLLATDEDREGEAISYHLVQVLKPKVETKRMVFHEITKTAILNALEKGRDIRQRIVKETKAEGILVHTNRSCKLWSGFMYEMSRQIGENTNIPVVSFDGDQADPRNFSEAQYDTRVQGLTELMEERKS